MNESIGWTLTKDEKTIEKMVLRNTNYYDSCCMKRDFNTVLNWSEERLNAAWNGAFQKSNRINW